MARITQVELAKRLGVSQQAVSFALTNTGTLSKASRERINKEATRLGYRPNAAARSMLKGRMGNAAILCAEGLRSFLPNSLLSGVHNGLVERGHHLVLHHLSKSKISNPDYIPEVMRELAVDGVIIIYEGEGENRIRELIKSYSIPAIWVNRKDAVNCVYPDDFYLGCEAGRQLLAWGHRQVAYLGGEPGEKSHYSVGDRLDGFRKTMEAGGGTVAYCFDQEVREDDQAFSKLLEDREITACFGYGPRNGEFALLAALRAGRRVPDDLSILVPGEAMDMVGHVKLSVLRIPFYWVGRKAVELLEWRIGHENKDVPSEGVRHLQLDEGQTAGPLFGGNR